MHYARVHNLQTVQSTYVYTARPVARLGRRHEEQSIWTEQKQDVIAVVQSRLFPLHVKASLRDVVAKAGK